MIEKDTVRLLRECDAGVKMGISAIDGVIEYVESEKLKRTLAECRREHKVLETELKEELERLGEKSKEPNPVAEGMSKMKTAAKFAFGGDDSTAATLMADGCNMGIKSLSKYLNEYEAAEEYSKDIAKRLIKLEDKLATDVRGFL